MTDHNKLKLAAEACQQHQPLRFMRSHGALYIRNDNGIVFDVHQNRSFPEFMAQNKDYADLALAANPEMILALIDENERLSQTVESLIQMERATGNRAIEYAGKCDDLKAEVAGLKTGYEAYERVNAELKAENETLIAAAQALRDEWRKDQADAKRYQWLRDSSQYDWDVSYGKLELRIETPHVDSSDLDACIDAALCQGEQS